MSLTRSAVSASKSGPSAHQSAMSVDWKGKTSGKQILQVSSYLLSLHGSKPANAKEPQGQKEAAGKPVAGL